MRLRSEFGSWILVTVVTVMIWLWAAGATRDEDQRQLAVEFTNARNGWRISPGGASVRVTLSGSTLALDKARAVSVLPVPLAFESAGEISVDLMEQIRKLDVLSDLGVEVTDAEPREIRVQVDEEVSVPVSVRRTLEGIDVVSLVIEGGRAVAVVARMPSRLARQIPSTLTVELDPSVFEGLAPGQEHVLEDVPLRVPDALRSRAAEIVLEPSAVDVTVQVKSRTQPFLLETVRVQIAGPPEDWDEYDVDVAPSQLRNVTVRGDSTIAARITDGIIRQVFAVLHLSSSEKESGIEHKAISYVIAIEPDGRIHVLDLDLTPPGAQPPEVALTITRRTARDGAAAPATD